MNDRAVNTSGVRDCRAGHEWSSTAISQKRSLCENYSSPPKLYNRGKLKLNFGSFVVAAVLEVIHTQTWARAAISALGQH